MVLGLVTQLNGDVEDPGSISLSRLPFYCFLDIGLHGYKMAAVSTIITSHLITFLKKGGKKDFSLNVSVYGERKYFLGADGRLPFIFLCLELQHMAILKPFPPEENEMTKTGIARPGVKKGSERAPKHFCCSDLNKTEVLLTRKERLPLSK